MYPKPIDNTGWKYYFYNHPDKYESDPCWIVKTKRERIRELFTLPSPEARTENSTSS